ncbi:MAG: di-trans,poly-cis-decaprenylcistransferase [Spirochaetales bacterium]|nr:di-trans,poly-cis-decaprenylcistransferase [Spirochaetales bacterium]
MDPARLPKHVGIIMDGNGRWALNHHQPRTFGHNEGLKAAKRVVRAAAEIDIPFVTLYTFSTENWKRAQEEVSFLMNLLIKHLRREFDFYREYKIRVVISGLVEDLPLKVQEEIREVQADTKDFDHMTVNLAINYGGKNEIVRSVNRWLDKRCGSELITESDIAANLDHAEIPEVDLVIRSAGEMRISNFFIWQSAYAEYYFSSKLWPDWDARDLLMAVKEYQDRDRKFGAIL